jgi:hypothetical protein
MRRIGYWATAMATLAVVLGGARIMSANGQEHDQRGVGGSCDAATIRGDYGIQIQGTRPAPGGLTESVVGVVLRTYDRGGTFSQVANVKGSITGTVPDAPGFGTYDVNDDCSGIIRFQAAPGVVLEERFIIVDHGREIRSAVMSPTPVAIASVHQRIHAR